LPDGQISGLAVQSCWQKYSASRFTQIKSITPPSRSEEGRWPSSRTLERDAVDAGGAKDEGATCGRLSRVVLTPRRWRQVGGIPAGDGGKQARSPGRARNRPLKPLRAGMPGDSGDLAVTMLVWFIFFPREAAGAAGTRHSPRPLLGEGCMHNSGASRRGNADVYLKLEQRHCERSEAIQSPVGSVDCFVAVLLAMTGHCQKAVYPPSMTKQSAV
jgi:hypothetical protein